MLTIATMTLGGLVGTWAAAATPLVAVALAYTRLRSGQRATERGQGRQAYYENDAKEVECEAIGLLHTFSSGPATAPSAVAGGGARPPAQ